MTNTELHDRQQRFMALLRPLQPNLERFAYAMARDREEARDIAGETILIAWERFDSVKHPEAFLSFLFTVATRIHRKRRRLFLMKRATRHPIRPLLLQILSIRLYYPHQIGTVFQVVDEVLGIEHYCFNSAIVAPFPP